jgi:methionine sulfoxide reductase heme-binding subunit
MTSELLWYTSRATGVASVVLLTLVVVLGTLLAGRRARPATATVRTALHRWLSLGMVVFLAVHIVTAISEGFVKIGWLAVVVPFVSGWQPGWIGLGALAVDVLLLLMITSWLRPRLPERAWRAVHWAAYALWPLTIVHGLVLGTANEPILRGVTIACAAVGASFITWRSLSSTADRDRRRDVLASEWS